VQIGSDFSSAGIRRLVTRNQRLNESGAANPGANHDRSRLSGGSVNSQSAHH